MAARRDHRVGFHRNHHRFHAGLAQLINAEAVTAVGGHHFPPILIHPDTVIGHDAIKIKHQQADGFRHVPGRLSRPNHFRPVMQNSFFGFFPILGGIQVGIVTRVEQDW